MKNKRQKQLDKRYSSNIKKYSAAEKHTNAGRGTHLAQRIRKSVEQRNTWYQYNNKGRGRQKVTIVDKRD